MKQDQIWWLMLHIACNFEVCIPSCSNVSTLSLGLISLTKLSKYSNDDVGVWVPFLLQIPPARPHHGSPPCPPLPLHRTLRRRRLPLWLRHWRHRWGHASHWEGCGLLGREGFRWEFGFLRWNQRFNPDEATLWLSLITSMTVAFAFLFSFVGGWVTERFVLNGSYRVFFLTGTPPKSSKCKIVNLG